MAQENNNEIGMLKKNLSSPSKEKSKIDLATINYSPSKVRKMSANKWIN